MPRPFDLTPLRGRPRLRTRFAPSITGHLHLGHLVNAVWVWGIARATGAEVVLRLEDHDRGRYRPEFEDSILTDLDWLGLTPDLGSTYSFRAGPSPFRQSDCEERYETALARCTDAGSTYACDCRRTGGPENDTPGPGGEVRYPGTCRDRRLGSEVGRRIRIRMEGGVERFTDLALGPQEQDPSLQCGDVVARDIEGHWTYQFAVAVDDLAHGITLVIRGSDLLASTARQIRVARMLGRETSPTFLHHPLLTDRGGRKLSKRDFAKGLREHRAEGRTPQSLLGEAAFLSGLLPAARSLDPDDLAGLFAGSA